MTSPKILLIEDDRSTAIALRNSVASEIPDSEIVMVAKTHEEVVLLDGQPFDLILADLMLPDTDHPEEIIEHCQRQFPQTPVIVVSGLSDPEAARRIAAMPNTYGYFSKTAAQNAPADIGIWIRKTIEHIPVGCVLLTAL